MRGTLGQAFEFAGAVYTWLIIGLIYDGFRLLRMPFPNKPVTIILDSAFYIVAGAVFGYSLFVLNGGTLRLYIIAGALLGVAWEQFGVSLTFRRMISHFLRKTAKK